MKKAFPNNKILIYKSEDGYVIARYLEHDHAIQSKCFIGILKELVINISSFDVLNKHYGKDIRFDYPECDTKFWDMFYDGICIDLEPHLNRGGDFPPSPKKLAEYDVRYYDKDICHQKGFKI